MQLSALKGTNLDLTDAIKAYVDERLKAIEKIVQDFEPTVEVTINVEKTTNHHNKGEVFKADMVVQVPGERFHASETAEDLYEAIDRVKDQMRRQLKDYKEKLSDKQRRGARPDKA